jgi:hypothetical protein
VGKLPLVGPPCPRRFSTPPLTTCPPLRTSPKSSSRAADRRVAAGRGRDARLSAQRRPQGAKTWGPLVPPSARPPSRRRAYPLSSRAHWSGRRAARRFFGGSLLKAAATCAQSAAKKPSGALSRAAASRRAALGAAARPVRRTAPRALPTRCAHGGERAGAGGVGVWGHHLSGRHRRDA